MDIRLNRDLEGFVRDKVRSGQFLLRGRGHRGPARQAPEREDMVRGLEAMIDHEFEAVFLAREGDDRISLEEVLEAAAEIPGSMAQAIIDDERADRF